MARRAHAHQTLLEQINACHPHRSKASDGWIGDTAHASRKSDHNPNKAGVVVAADYTHDPANGFDSYAFAEHLRTSKDPRINYVISNGRIFSGNRGASPWVWRKYTGANKHNKHVHISLLSDAQHYDNDREWTMPGAATA